MHIVNMPICIEWMKTANQRGLKFTGEGGIEEYRV